jgi:outer membrane receptor for ferrienterochelin and colicin
LLLVAASVVAPHSAHALTGTVTGRVVDSEGDPLSDANVVLPELQIGAATKPDGSYSIGGVPVGTWVVIARMPGRRSNQRRIQVDAGRSSVADFKLADTPYRVPGVTIVGRKETAIRVDPQTKTYVSQEKLHDLPIQDYKEAIGLTAGVTTLAGEVHFRAGRADEVLTLVNGIPSKNPMQSEGVELGLLSIAGVEQVLGGMDAQYGKALSGVIALTTREGTDRFSGEARYFTDRYGERDKSFNDFERLSLGVGGPFLFPKTSYFVSYQGTFSDTYLPNVASHREHRFLDFIRIGNRQSNASNLTSKVTWRASPNKKVALELLQNASLTGRYHHRWNRNGFVQVRSDSAAPTDGSITRQYGTWAWYQVDSTFVPMNTAEHLPVRDDDYQQLALSWRHSFGQDSTLTVYNVRASRQEWRSKTDVLGRELWEYEQEPNQYYDALNRLDGPFYVTNGDYPFYERRRTTTFTLNSDISRSFPHHHLMAGGELTYNDLEYLFTQYPNVLDAHGNYGATRDQFRSFNPEGSFFLQDRWDYQGMVLNAGIRYDAFAVGNQVPDVRDPVKVQWSPRIGVAYPISDRDVMSFHYGRLFQVPDRLYIYQGRNISAEARGNPNLAPETTISYQLGVQHKFSNEVYLQASVYFKDIFGLLTTVPQEIPGYAITIQTYVNGDYASARGLDLTLIKQESHGFSGEINYSYGNASGTASDPNRALPSRGNLRDQYKPTSEQPLKWDQRHNFSATLRLGGEKDWGASFVYQFGTGFPYTPEQRQERRRDPSLVYSRRLPPISTLSVQAHRRFEAWGQRVTLYLQGTNLLDARNISELQPSLWPDNAVNSHSYNVYYTETGRAGGAFLTADQNGDGREDWIAVDDPRVFQPGRVIRMGLGVEF